MWHVYADYSVVSYGTFQLPKKVIFILPFSQQLILYSSISLLSLTVSTELHQILRGTDPRQAMEKHSGLLLLGEYTWKFHLEEGE